MKFAYIYATVYATPAYLGPVRWHRGGERVMRGQWAIVSLPLILACLRIFFKIGLHENLRLKNSQFWVIRSKNEMLCMHRKHAAICRNIATSCVPSASSAHAASDPMGIFSESVRRTDSRVRRAWSAAAVSCGWSLAVV